MPLKFQYRAGYGYDYDSYGLPTLGPGAANIPSTWGGVQYNLMFNTYLGATLYTNSVRLAKLVTISAKADELETWYTMPHHTITTNIVDDARLYAALDETAGVLLTYRDPQRRRFLGCRSTDGVPGSAGHADHYRLRTFTGLAAFDGFATSRNLSGSFVYTPTPYFALNLTMQHFDVTPAPVPGLGGQAPDQLVADVRMRLSRNILVDISRGILLQLGE